MTSINKADFNLINEWFVDEEGARYTEGPERGQPQFMVDLSTGRKYLNETKGCVRVKCILLSFGTPIVHPLASIANIAFRLLRILSFYNFWNKREDATYNFKGRLKDTGMDVARMILTPLTILALELATIYGWFSPYNGRKLYATLERAAYGHYILAPCFQPDPQGHAFGGDINTRDAF